MKQEIETTPTCIHEYDYKRRENTASCKKCGWTIAILRKSGEWKGRLDDK